LQGEAIMLDQDDIDRLMEIGAVQREELLAVRSAARTTGSDIYIESQSRNDYDVLHDLPTMRRK
jgi:hypothetical protein